MSLKVTKLIKKIANCEEFGATGNCVNRKWAIDQVGRAGRGGVTRAEGRGAEARPVAVWAGGACRGRRAFPPGSRARSLLIHFGTRARK